MKKWFLICLALAATNAVAQPENPAGGLDGAEFQYTYEDGGEVILTFYDGLLRFEWVDGPLKGNKQRDLPYQLKAIDEQVYIVSWHNREAGSFPTLHIDIPRKRIFGSALINYHSQDPLVLFDSAVISRADLPR